MVGFKKIIYISISVVALLIVSSAATAGGGAVTGGAREITQLLNHSELVTQIGKLSEQINNQIIMIAKEVEQIVNQITMIQDMILNTLSLPQQLFGNVTQIFNRIKSVMDRTRGVAYTMMNFDEELKKRFKSYSNMSGLHNTMDFQQEYRQIIETQMETTRSTLESIGVAWDQLEKDDTKTLERLQNLAKSAEGRNQIMQSTNQFLGFLSEESLKLRQLVMMQAQMTGVALEAERAEKDAAQKRHEESLNSLQPMFRGFENFEFEPFKP